MRTSSRVFGVGLSLWLSVELLATAGILAGLLIVVWARDGQDRVRRGLRFAIGLLLGVLVGVVAEHRPSEWIEPVYDKVSIVHAVLASAYLLFWVAAGRWATGGRRVRIGAAVLGASVIGVGTVLLFPGLLVNPIIQEYPRLDAIWLAKIEEFQPLGPGSAGWGRFLIYLGSFFLAFPTCLYWLWRGWRRPEWGGWLFATLLSVVFFVLGVRHYRFGLFYQAVGAIPLAALLAGFLVLTREIGNGYLRAGARVVGPLLILLGPFAAGVASSLRGGGDAVEPGAGARCDMASMGRHLEAWQPEPQIIIANLGFGAEIVYRTQHNVVGDVTHRNAQGIIDSYDFFSAADDREPRRIAQERGVDAVLVCLDPSERKFFIRDDGGASLFDRLRTGVAPPWLASETLPGPLWEMFRFYRVQGLDEE